MDDRLSQFVEKIGSYYESQGMPLSAGRVFGLLLISEKPLTLEEIANSLQISKASVSIATRMWENADMVKRVTVRGERKIHYKMSVESWPYMFQYKAKTLTYMGELAKEGLTLVPEDAKNARENLEMMKEFFDFMADEFDDLVDKWLARSAKKHKEEKRDRGNVSTNS